MLVHHFFSHGSRLQRPPHKKSSQWTTILVKGSLDQNEHELGTPRVNPCSVKTLAYASSQFAAVSRVPHSDTLNLPDSGYSHTNIFLCRSSYFSSLFGACKYKLGGCMYASSPFLSLLPRVAHRTMIPHLSAPWPPLISSFSPAPVVKWPGSSQTLHFLDALPQTRSCGSRCSSMCPPTKPGLALSACWISQLCMVLAQTTRILSRCSTSTCLACALPASLTFRFTRSQKVLSSCNPGVSRDSAIAARLWRLTSFCHSHGHPSVTCLVAVFVPCCHLPCLCQFH